MYGRNQPITPERFRRITDVTAPSTGSSRFFFTLNVRKSSRLGIRNGKRTVRPASRSAQCLRTNSSKPASETITTFAGTAASRTGARAASRWNTTGPRAVRRSPSV